ncbi:MAG: RNA polymerase sigma factor [Proteobacteria bacterium]|nr:RNA polymerase sigma factor [Pseudomonadota bacterium]
MSNTGWATALRADATEPEIDDVRRAAGGDVHAFERLMRRHNRLAFRTARSILRDDAEAEDALQDAYLCAWRALGGFRADARFSTWLVRIVINEALARRRRHASAQVIPLDSAVDADGRHAEEWMQDDADRRPDHAALRAEARRFIEAHIDRLPEGFRSVFVLRAVEELSVEEAAQLLDVPEATVRTRYFRARGLLRESLARDIDLGLADVFAFDGERCDRIVARVLARIV